VRRRRFRLQNRLVVIILLTTAPATIAAAALLWIVDAGPTAKVAVLGAIGLTLALGAAAARRTVVRPLQSLANMLEGLREGDYSMRGRNVDPEDALGEVMVEVNSLSSTLYAQRLEALEAGMLLQKVIGDVDIAVFALDGERNLRIVNRAGAELLGGDRDALRGRGASELGLLPMLEGPSGRIVSHVFPGGRGRWEVRRRSFHEGGRRLDLVVVTDVSRALREEERQAWQRLVRVIGHELNSSLTPIKSMAATLRKLIERDPPPADWREDAQRGLKIIHDRAEALGRFMNGYARLARLPPPTRRDTDFVRLVEHAAALYGGRVQVQSKDHVRLNVDGDQIEQVLINLIKNAVEAVGDGGDVRIRWSTSGSALDFEIEDDGPGLARTDNLWVPFFTTKPKGTGLGLVLSRDIVENHGGSITLANRGEATGCIARVSLPLD
jgi:nitrogen fixation/metabolism regulation signal transduction histidine kinase